MVAERGLDRAAPRHGARIRLAKPLSLVAMGLAAAQALAATPGALTAGPPAGSYVLPVIQLAPAGSVLDTDARSATLARFTTGKVSLLSFMYTYCADPVGCPLVFNTFYALRTRLLADPALARQIRFVSLSFDPGHDTPETMRLYAGKLAAAASALRWHFLTTGSLAQLRPILDGLGQSVQLQAHADGTPGRFYYHMVKVFLIDASGRVREIYSTAFLQPDIIYNDLRTLVMEQQNKGEGSADNSPSR